MASALAGLGALHALVVHSDDGLDEISVTAPTAVWEVTNGEVTRQFTVDPGELDLAADDPATLKGGDAAENLRRIREILSGRERSAASEAVAVNAAAALMVAGLSPDLAGGLRICRDVLDSGAADERLKRLAERSSELAADG
jgi:anthranilate phosphoribosyltransferase